MNQIQKVKQNTDEQNQMKLQTNSPKNKTKKKSLYETTIVKS